MKIDVSNIDREQFNVKESVIAGESCSLVFPKKIGAIWDRSNLILRSSIWNSEGELISAGYRKFFNWDEQPSLVKIPYETKKLKFLEKIDGSLLSVSKYKGQLIVRTRGTSDAEDLGTGGEIELFMSKYPLAFQFEEETAPYSRIFEWTTPNNRIVIDYGSDPELWLTGKIFHSDYSYEQQEILDKEAARLGVKRPKTYQFDTIDQMISTVEAFKNIEGVCVYFNRGQDIRKVKGADYLMKHRFKSNATFDNTLALFVGFGRPSFKDFEFKLIEMFDYECYSMVRGFASKICDSYREVQTIIASMERFVAEVRLLPSRKEQADKIIQSYGNTNRSGFVFGLLDNKPIDDDGIKKLIFQVNK